MARTGSTTSTRTSTRRRRTDETPAEVATTEAAPETTEAVLATDEHPTEATEEATTMSTETVEPEVVETTDSDTPDAVEVTSETTDADTDTEAKAKAAEAEAEAKMTEFETVVDAALAERDTSTGTVPDAQIEAVKASYRALASAKYKNRAKKHLNNKLKDAVNGQDIILGGAVMALADAVENAGASPRTPTERKPADPATTYRERMVVLHLAYNLARNNVPEGVNDAEELAKVEAKVEELSAAADSYLAWLTSTAEDKGDEPEVDVLVKKAVKASQGRAAQASGKSTSTPRVSDGTRRNVRTHIAQVFADKPSGTFLKVAEIAKTPTEEYPDASCSPGAISAALKSDKGVEGFKPESNESGNLGARKL